MIDEAEVRSRIESVAASAMELSPLVSKDVAFHMTDWLSDLASYFEFCSNPSSKTDEQVSSMLLQFLCHVPNHLAAAAKLYADFPVSDVFEVGAVRTERDAAK